MSSISVARRLFTVAALLAAFFIGRTLGICHAVVDASPYEVTSQHLLMELDGQLYEYCD